jgi:hypothetical protein
VRSHGWYVSEQELVMFVSYFPFLISNDLVSVDIGSQFLNHHISPSLR